MTGLTASPPNDVVLSCAGICYRRDRIDRHHVGEPHQLDLWRVRTVAPALGSDDLHEMIASVLAAAIGPRSLAHVRMATEGEIEKDSPTYELGAVPPLGSLVRAPTFVDPEVMRHDTLVFAAGTRTESIKVRSEDLFSNEPVTVAPLTRLSDADEDLIGRWRR